MRNGRNDGLGTLVWLLAGLLTVASAQALHREPDPASVADNEVEEFYDAPLPEPVAYPAWFKLSFLDFADDLAEAVSDGKRGLLVYFGQKYCAYCEKLLEVNFAEKADIVDYTRKYFDVIGMDIHGQRTVTPGAADGRFKGMSIFNDRRTQNERRQTDAMSRIHCRRQRYSRRRDPAERTRPWWLCVDYLRNEVQLKRSRRPEPER